MMSKEEEMLYDAIVGLGIATENEINLAFNIAPMGWTDTLNAIIYIRTGYRTLEQFLDEEED